METESIRAAFRRYYTDIIGIAYNGLVYQVNKVRSMALMRRELSVLETRLSEISPVLRNKLRIGANNIYYWISRNSLVGTRKAEKSINYSERLLKRSTAVFEGVKSEIINSGMVEKLINEAVKQFEYDKKLKYLTGAVLGDKEYTPFMICDVYKDCAKDHLPYQGKIYYKEGWQDNVSDAEVRAKIEVYIKNHHCMSVESVTGAPVYLMMRPYCRHKLYNIPIENVLSKSARAIIRERGLEHEGSGRKSDADRAHRAYLDRVEIYRDLWDVAQNPALGKELNASRKLYKKWLNLSRR